MTFFFRDYLFFEIGVRENTASQSLSYGIFANTSGNFRTFSCAYAEGKKLEEILHR